MRNHVNRLILDKTSIDPTVITDFVNQNRKVKYLYLFDNKLNDHGVETICKSLVFNANLELIKLGNNLLTEKSLQSFINLLMTNTTLQHIDMPILDTSGREILNPAIKILRKRNKLIQCDYPQFSGLIKAEYCKFFHSHPPSVMTLKQTIMASILSKDPELGNEEIKKKLPPELIEEFNELKKCTDTMQKSTENYKLNEARRAPKAP